MLRKKTALGRLWWLGLTRASWMYAQGGGEAVGEVNCEEVEWW